MFSFNFLSAYYAGFHLNGGLLAILFSLMAVVNPIYAALLGRGGLNPRIIAGAVIGVVGVIGPTRLNYARVVPMVDFTANRLSRLMA